MKRWLLAGALVVGLSAPLLAQAVIYQDLSGNECWNAGQGPGGPASFLCTDVVRNSRQIVAGALSGSLTFGTGTLAQLRYGGNAVFTTQPLALTTFIAPPNPVQDGAIIGACNPTAANFGTTNIQFTTSTGQTIVGATSTVALGAGTCMQWQFNRGNTTWYRIR